MLKLEGLSVGGNVFWFPSAIQEKIKILSLIIGFVNKIKFYIT